MKHNLQWAPAALLSCLLASMTALAGPGKSSNSNEPVSDGYITARVKVVLTKDNVSNVRVQAANGVVTLNGTARSEADKDKAEQDARAVQGVSDVRNQLVVRQP